MYKYLKIIWKFIIELHLSTIRLFTKRIMSGSRCYSQESFRRELIKRDQHCILSGLSAEVCEAAHIVNKEFLQNDSKELRFTKQNGMLLSSNLHKEFDMHFWTVDIDHDIWERSKDDESLDITFSIKLYPPAKKKKQNNLTLDIFNYTHITIPKSCIPFFIHRNEIVIDKLYNPNHYTYEGILKHIKQEFNSQVIRVNGNERIGLEDMPEECSVPITPRMKKKSIHTKTKKKKRSRYTKQITTQIRTWIDIYRDQNIKPTLEDRRQFCNDNNMDDKLFETRFTKYWSKK